MRNRTPQGGFLIVLGFVVMASGIPVASHSQTQLEMNDDAAAKAKAADAALNATYMKLNPTPELKRAERAWITFRDAECSYEASVYEGGSIQPMTYSLCVERVTKARADELSGLSRFEEYRHR